MAVVLYVQKWLRKILGYDFETLYQPGLQNKAVDTLSRINPPEFHVLTAPGIVDVELVMKEVEKDGEL